MNGAGKRKNWGACKRDKCMSYTKCNSHLTYFTLVRTCKHSALLWMYLHMSMCLCNMSGYFVYFRAIIFCYGCESGIVGPTYS